MGRGPGVNAADPPSEPDRAPAGSEAGAGDPTLIVTGAAHGLGAAISSAAVASGWRVGVLDRNGEAAEALAESVGEGSVALEADTSDEGSVERALDRFAEATGSAAPDGVVCNAGIVRFGPLLELTVEDWRAVADVNLTGTFISARAVARRAVAAGRPASIVTVTSMNGVQPGPNAGAYGATKAGAARLTQQMALEWGSLGIRANAVAPGLIDAGMSEPIYADPEIRQRRSERVPLGRLGTGAEVASAVLFLLSREAAYVNGVELLVDGGVTMSVIATLPRPHAVDSVGADDGAHPGPVPG
ncbi:MAG: SDR family NAD(P)-dependent oxidoreductase [Microthrixaceae bacterium]